MDPETVDANDAQAPAPGPPAPAPAPPAKKACDECGSTELSITPVPGLWLQYWCDACDHWWWETQDGHPITPAS